MGSYKFIITGRVQGVFYRATIQKAADSTGFSGYVKNLPNGSVEACVSCDKERLNKFIDILKKGSVLSDVTDIQQLECSKTFTDGFLIH